ncbi:MAG TPA: GAF and ANTAR domain-containing protein [Actinomycetes bacterium]|nr:GAF and ANTAR domain-containing protein [Actinomycetes bacterium]
MPNPGSAQPTPSLIEAFSEIAQHVQASENPEDSMERITQTAVDAVHGCDSASLSLLTPDGPTTRAATDRVARDGDQIQYDLGEGPCLDAAMHERWVYVPDMREDPRWPASSIRLAEEVGVGSMVSCRLTLDAAPNHTLRGMNLYSTVEDGFTGEDQMRAILLASLGAVVVDASQQQAHLRAAIESRQVIGEAIGIIKSQHPQVSSDEAFAILAKASQRMNIKLRDLARRITEGDQVAAPGSKPLARPKSPPPSTLSGVRAPSKR